MSPTPGSTAVPAVDGRREAWDLLYYRYDRVLRSIVRSYRLPDADADEVIQITWLRLVENIAKIRDAEAIGGWLVTTARRECLRVKRQQARESIQDPTTIDAPAVVAGPEQQVIERERDAALWAAVRGLPERAQRVIVLQASGVASDYQQLSERLDMPVGSIGPTRGRSLERLARDGRLAAVAR